MLIFILNKFYRVSLYFLILGFMVNKSVLAISIPYQYVVDFDEEKLLIEVINLNNKKTYYLCSLETKECSSLTKSISLSRRKKSDYFFSQNKNYFIYQAYDKKNRKFITILVTPKGIQILPVKTKIFYVEWQENNPSKVAIVSRKNIFIFESLNNSFKKLVLPVANSELIKFSPSFKYVLLKTNQKKEFILWNLITNDFYEIDLKNKDDINFANFVGDKFLLFKEENQEGFSNFIFYEIETKTSKPLFENNFIIDSFLIDKNKIYFIANKDNYLQWNLYQIDLETKEIKKIVENVTYEFNLVKLDNFLVVKKTGELPPEIVLINLDNFEVEKLNLNLDAKPIKIGEILKVNETSGVIIKPNDFDPNREYDLIVWLHGGPMRQTSIGYHPYLSYGVFDFILDELRKDKRIIAKIDYVGSWGYGLDYQEKLKGNIGKLDVESVMQFINHLRNTFKIKNIYLIGLSYGGYLSLKLLYEYPEFFAGAVSVNGVTDWRKLIKSIPSSPFKSYFKNSFSFENKSLYDQADLYLNPEKLRNKKIFIIYGQKDKTIPSYQHRLFYLKYNKIAKIMIKKYNNEGHILIFEENIKDFLKNLDTFFSQNN